MPAFVVDASVSAAWLLPDEANPYTEAALQATAKTQVWVPTLWLIEMSNLLLGAQRRKRIDSLRRRELALALADILVTVDREPIPLPRLVELASRHGLTAHDAVYLELAQRREAGPQ